MYELPYIDAWQQSALDPELSPDEKRVRDLFVREYMVDFDPFLAALRMGFHKTFAAEYAGRFMGESYVQRKIKEAQQAGNPDDETTVVSNKQRIIAMLFREANNRGPGSSQAGRVAALSKLAQIHGLDKEPQKQVDSVVPMFFIGGETEEEYESRKVVPIQDAAHG